MDTHEICLIASVVIEKDGKILLVQEGKELAKGTWNIPAGHVDPGEDILVAARREAKEETGFDVGLDNFLGVYYILGRKSIVVRIVFNAHITGGKIKLPKEEIMDAKWFTADEVLRMPAEKLRGIKEIVTDFKEGIRYPLETVKTMGPYSDFIKREAMK